MSEPGTSLSPANAVLSAVGLLPTLISGDFRYESGGRDTSPNRENPEISGELTGTYMKPHSEHSCTVTTQE